MAHKDLEFAVAMAKAGGEKIYKTFAEACGFAVCIAVSTGEDVNIDVLCWSRAAAIDWQGDAGADSYDEDPDASVFERIVVKADSQGRVA